MKKNNFLLTFETEEDEKVREYCLEGLNCEDSSVEAFLDQADDEICEIEENYGTHDFGGHETDDADFMGFFSCEVELEKINEVIEKWKKILVKYNMCNEDQDFILIDICDME